MSGWRDRQQRCSASGGGAHRPFPSGPNEFELALLARILDLVRTRKGLDLTGYRRGTLLRRVKNRMIAANVPTLDGYLDLLGREPEETDLLIERLTIKVSRFFRGAETFEAIRAALEGRRRSLSSPRPLRLWSAGCGCGEEPYSLAILLAELGPVAPGGDAILATDVDSAALAAAAAACYGPAALEGLAAELVGRYFDELAGRRGPTYRLKPEIRQRVELRPGDLVSEAPPVQGGLFDLVCCRNVLIYVEPAVQARILDVLARSLLPDGLLCLGEAEWPVHARAGRFEVVSRRARLFRLVAHSAARESP